MNSKMFLIERGKFVVVRDNNDNEISFSTMEEFKNIYPEIGTFIDDKYYLDYEPNRSLHHIAFDDNGCQNLYFDVPFVQEYEDIINNVQLLIIRKNDPYYGKTLEDAKTIALLNLKNQTRYQINQYLPDWKHFRWATYVQIYEKVNFYNQLPTILEGKIYQKFGDKGKTNEVCYNECVKGLEWIVDCVEIHDACEAAINRATNITEIKNIAAAYPKWPL